MPFKERDSTLMRVKLKTWKKLNDMRDDPNSTFDDVLNNLINYYEEHKGKGLLEEIKTELN